MVPLFADQPLNAMTVEQLGAAFALTGGEQELDRIGEALAAVLEDPRYRAAAEHAQGRSARARRWQTRSRRSRRSSPLPALAA